MADDKRPGPWARDLVIAVLGAGGGVAIVSVANATGLGSSTFWWALAGYLVASLGVGLVLRRSRWWALTPWEARRRELTWRQRRQVERAVRRARAVEDPDLAQVVIERLGAFPPGNARLDPSYERILSVVTALTALIPLAALVTVATALWRGEPVPWLVVGFGVVMAVVVAGLRPVQRRLWWRAARRTQYTLEVHRALAARRDSPGDEP